MEEWKIMLYRLMDQSEHPKQMDNLAQKLFQYLSTTKIKDKNFTERIGRDYEKMIAYLDSDLTSELLTDDFLDLTIKLTKKYSSKTNPSKD